MSIAHEERAGIQEIQIHSIPKGKDYLLTLAVPYNEIGIICRVTSVLFLHGWDIIEANAETSKDGYVRDAFLIRGRSDRQMDFDSLEEIRLDLNQLFYGGLSVMKYFEDKTNPQMFQNFEPCLKKTVRIYNPDSNDVTVIDVRAKDRPGLLFQISEILFLSGIDILSFSARSEDGEIRDTFLVRKENGSKIVEEDIIETLKAGILEAL